MESFQQQDPTDARLARDRIARTLTVLLGIYFAVGGAMKLTGPEQLVTAFADWGYPSWFLYAVGATELAAGALVLVPGTTAFGGFVLTGVMVGAVFTHVVAAEWGALVLPLALAIGTTLVAWHYAPDRFKQALSRFGTSRPLAD